MYFIWEQLGHVASWLQQGGNSNIILIGITAWYAILTHWIMKATHKQATAVLQPQLSIHPMVRQGEQTFHTLIVKNSGDRPIVFLDVRNSCHPDKRDSIVHNLHWDDQILPPGEDYKLKINFQKELEVIGVHESSCGFRTTIVVCDLSRQVAIEYEYLWVLGRFSCKSGMPWRVRFKYWIRPWGWRYHRVYHWVRERFKKSR
jgi:hypothetical protein